MASSLVVETGAIVANATSYVTLTEARSYASARGVTLSATDATLDIIAIKAMDFLESLRDSYQGEKVDASQELQFPREDVYIDGILQDSASIPSLLKKAQCQLMIEIHNGINLMPTRTTAAKKKSKVGPIETEYFAETPSTPNMPAVEALIEPLFKTSSVGMISVIRA